MSDPIYEIERASVQQWGTVAGGRPRHFICGNERERIPARWCQSAENRYLSTQTCELLRKMEGIEESAAFANFSLARVRRYLRAKNERPT